MIWVVEVKEDGKWEYWAAFSCRSIARGEAEYIRKWHKTKTRIRKYIRAE